MTRVTCRKVQAAFARDGADPVRAAGLHRHLESCASCLAHERVRSAVRESVLDANDVLDDGTRTRVLARLLAARDFQAPGRVTPRGPLRPFLRPLLAPLAIAAVFALVVTGGRRGRRAEPGTAASPVHAPVALEPYAGHSLTADGGRSIPRGRLDRLELPSQASMRARLGTLADLVLLGPLALVVRNAESARVELELRTGTLVGDFDGTGGRSLRISTADAIVDIVGTRFLVEASSERTRVSVEHGRVRVESRKGVRTLDAGRSWTTDEEMPGPSDARVARIFALAARGDLAGPDRDPATTAAVTLPAAKPQEGRGPFGPPHAHERRLATNSRRGDQTETPARTTPFPSNPDAERPFVARRAESEHAAPPRAPSWTPPPSTAPPPVVSPPDPGSPPARPRVTPPLKPVGLYQQAESAFSQGDDAKGKQLLNELVRAFPDEAMADSARFELALLAEKAGKPNEAMAATREILRAGAKGPFVEPARLLRCRIHLADDKVNAALCLKRFVRDYPKSPHDDFALRTLTELAQQAGHCAEAAELAALYLQRHPQGAFATEASRVRRGCGD